MRQQWERVLELTDAPLAIHHTGRPRNEEAFAASLDFRPTVIFFIWAYQPGAHCRALALGAQGGSLGMTAPKRRFRSR